MDIRFACPVCEQHIAIDEAGAGMQVDCPGCQSQVTVPAPAPAKPRLRLTSRPAEEVPPAETAPVAPPPLPVSAPTGAEYRCNNRNCGAILFESQLSTVHVGGKAMRVCPKCRLGVTKITVERSFWTKLPGAFAYPFRGAGAFVLLLGTPILLANDFLGFGIFMSLVKLILLGLIGSVLINIIHSTADNESAPLEWPDFGDRFEMITVGLQIVGLALLVFGPAIACLVLMISTANPGWTLGAIGCGILGLAYYPMAFLAFAMFDTLNGVNPVVVVPAIVKLPLQYAVILCLIGAMLVARGALGLVTAGLPLLWRLGCMLPLEVVAFYSLIVSSRLLGLLYKSNASQLGWFE